MARVARCDEAAIVPGKGSRGEPPGTVEAQAACGHAADRPQYLLAIGSSSAGNRLMTWQPLSVTTTSSSMRAAE